jgi:hypothetical protein
LQLRQGAERRLLDALDPALGHGAETNGDGDGLVVVEQQGRHGRTRSQAVSPGRAPVSLDGVAEPPQAVDVVADGSHAYAQPGREFGSGADRLCLEQCEKAQQARRGFKHAYKCTDQSGTNHA